MRRETPFFLFPFFSETCTKLYLPCNGHFQQIQSSEELVVELMDLFNSWSCPLSEDSFFWSFFIITKNFSGIPYYPNILLQHSVTNPILDPPHFSKCEWKVKSLQEEERSIARVYISNVENTFLCYAEESPNSGVLLIWRGQYFPTGFISVCSQSLQFSWALPRCSKSLYEYNAFRKMEPTNQSFFGSSTRTLRSSCPWYAWIPIL